MKSVMLAAVAALCVFALPVQAADAPATTTPETTSSNVATPYTVDKCAAELAKCQQDQACKDNLVKLHGCKKEG